MHRKVYAVIKEDLLRTQEARWTNVGGAAHLPCHINSTKPGKQINAIFFKSYIKNFLICDEKINISRK